MSLTIIDNNNIFQKDVIGNVRTAQEDSHDIAALTPNGDVFVVCDGMGGHVGGKQASSIAVRSIIEYLGKEVYPNPEQALNDALQFANMQILGYANEHPELKGMGTTACIVLLQDSEAYIAHVGDSRIYLYLGKEKELRRITKDHSFVQLLVDNGQITDEEAEHHPNKNRILQALGVKPDLCPSTAIVRPKNGDVFLICSDGLNGMVPDSRMRDVLKQNTSIEHKGETLINLALEAGGLDNITLELIQIANSPHTKTESPDYNPATNTGGSSGSNGIPKKIKQLMIALGGIAVCAAIVYGGYCCFWFAEQRKEFGDLEEKISQDSIALVSLKDEYLKDSISWEGFKLKENEVYKQYEKDTSNVDFKRSYEAAHHLTEGIKDSMSNKLEIIKTLEWALQRSKAQRDTLIKQKRKR
ncbi:MAG: Stp1/IreP family PP2C-type Ser/Thr phosphatase [Lentimicrobiaceae bacterium]|nr:Stp1/IreP family PP2C-type Ser/Thr phosphatase [Lentimicrobiaceae bacterium]